MSTEVNRGIVEFVPLNSGAVNSSTGTSVDSGLLVDNLNLTLAASPSSPEPAPFATSSAIVGLFGAGYVWRKRFRKTV